MPWYAYIVGARFDERRRAWEPVIDLSRVPCARAYTLFFEDTQQYLVVLDQPHPDLAGQEIAVWSEVEPWCPEIKPAEGEAEETKATRAAQARASAYG